MDDLQIQKREFSNKNFKWEYKSPNKKRSVVMELRLFVVDHDLEQVTKYLIDDGLDLEKILKHAKPLTIRDYKAIYRDKEYLITLDESGRLKRIFYVDT